LNPNTFSAECLIRPPPPLILNSPRSRRRWRPSRLELRFVPASRSVPLGWWVLAPFHPGWSLLNLRVVPFGQADRLFRV
jgi:hypothetical protein